MSKFAVPLIKILDIKRHLNADALEIVPVGGYECVIRKGQVSRGDRVAYIPEQAVVPRDILESIGLYDQEKGKGRLAGPRGDRVKAIRLRGVLSQGLLLPLNGELKDIEIGSDLSGRLGISKWEPPIPMHMQGEVYSDLRRTMDFDVENWKKYPDILQPGEVVVYTEKLHGTFCGISWVSEGHPEGFGENGQISVFSKGLGARGMAFKNNPSNEHNRYVRATETARRHLELGHPSDEDRDFFVLGEVTGKGVQDLAYEGEIRYRVFAVVTRKGDGPLQYMNWQEAAVFCQFNGLEMVPVLDRGPFDAARLRELAGGRSSVADCLREGVVVVPERERTDLAIGRVGLKYVSEAYLTRKGGTEFN